MKTDENGSPHAEENFEEAIKAVNYVLTSDEIPKEIVKLLNDDNCVNLTNKVIVYLNSVAPNQINLFPI